MSRTPAAPDAVLDHDSQRQVAVALFNRVWDLLDAGDARSADATDEMIDAAHASRFLWRLIGGVEQAIVGEWQISRVYAAAGLGAEAVRHADISLALLEGDPDVPDWLPASVHEGRARAFLAAGEPEAAVLAHATAHAALLDIADPEDRELIAAQLAELGLDDAPESLT
jgi:hypothetical protein